MDVQRVMESIRQFIDLHDWHYIHVKMEGPAGQREMYVSNKQVVDPSAPMHEIVDAEIVPAEESTLQKLVRIQSVTPEQRPQEGEDFEWFKWVQSQLGGNQIDAGDAPEVALNKIREAGLPVVD